MSAPRMADRIARRLSWEDLDAGDLRTLVELARREDLEGWGLAVKPAGTGDVSTAVLGNRDEPARAALRARQPLVACGLPLVPLILDVYGAGAAFEPATNDGAVCSAGDCMGMLAGPAGLLLAAERVLLNFLQRLCGVASHTRTYVNALGQSPTRLLDTRKTTPGLRVLEKYAVACGGGFNHRIGLFDRVMLKDNHLAAGRAAGGRALAELVGAARTRWPGLVIELEVDALGQIPPALDAGVDILLLDNFTVAQLRDAVELVGGRAVTEASGGITLEQLPALGQLGLDYLSTGATVHQATWKDIGLDWQC